MTRLRTITLTVATAGAFALGQAALAQSDQNTNSGQSTDSSSSAQSSTSTDNSGQSNTGRRSTSQSGSTSGQSGTGMSSSTSTSGSAASADATFAKKAAEGSLSEVKFGQLAQQKAQDQQVKDFAQRMIDDHTKASDELKSIAQNKNMTIPDSMNSKDQAEYDRLSKLSGDQFDKAYLRYMERDHRKDIAEFRKESQNGKDPDLKAFAAKYLPTLEQHLQMARADTKMEHGAASANTSGRHRNRGTVGTDNTGTMNNPSETNPSETNPSTSPTNPNNPSSNPRTNPNNPNNPNR